MTCDDIAQDAVAQRNDGLTGDDRALSPQATHNVDEFILPSVRK